MNSRLFGLRLTVTALVLFAACKEDPTASKAGTVAGLSLDLANATITVADSIKTFAVVLDPLGNPVDVAATVAPGCTAGIVAVVPASDAPQVHTAFYVKATAFGTACIVATAGGFTDTLQVTTIPASLSLTAGPDTLQSGQTGIYTYQYKDAKGVVLAGVPAPTFKASDTTIAKPSATAGQVLGRAPGLTTLTVSGPGGISTTKTVTVIAIAFTGTTSSPVDPGALLKIIRDPAAPVFDSNTVVSIGAVIKGTLFPDSLKVRISDVATSGAKTFSMKGVGPNDVAYSGGTYTVNTPAAFAGTVTPAPFAGATIWIHRAVADAPFDTSMRAFRGTTAANLAALTVDTSTVRPDSFKTTIADLAAGGTYLFQFTRVGATLAARRGSYVLPVTTWAGTMTPNAAPPTAKIILRKGGADPQFDADTRVFFNGVRTFIDANSTDTAVVIAPAFLSTSAKDLRISRMGAAQGAVDALAAFSNTTASPLDAFDHGNDIPSSPAPIAANGNLYLTMSGTCIATNNGGVASNGAADCDDYFKITNSTAAPATVTVTAQFFNGADIDIYICDGAALANPVPNNVPSCGTVTGFNDALNFNGATGASLESTGPFTLPAGATYIIWFNMFDNHGNASTLYKVNVSGLP
jgi:hypothetical protein